MKKTILGWTYGISVLVFVLVIDPEFIDTDLAWNILKGGLLATLGLLGILGYWAEDQYRTIKFLRRTHEIFLDTDDYRAFHIEDPWEFDSNKYVTVSLLELMKGVEYDHYVRRYGENWKHIAASKGYIRYRKREENLRTRSEERYRVFLSQADSVDKPSSDKHSDE